MTDWTQLHNRVRVLTDADLAGLTAPPGSPFYGAGYWLGGGATYTGDWAGKSGLVCTDESGAWIEIGTPHWGFPVTWANCPGHTKWVPAYYTQDGATQTPWATPVLPKDDGVLCPHYAPGNDGIFAVRVLIPSLPNNDEVKVAHGIDVDWSADFPPTIARADVVGADETPLGASFRLAGNDLVVKTRSDMTACSAHVWVVARRNEPEI